MVWPLTATPLQGRNSTTDQLNLQDIWGVAVHGNRAYLAGYRGIAIVDLTDEAQPHVIREVALPQPSFWVDIEDDLLFVGSLDGLRIFRLAGEDDLQEIGRFVAQAARSFARAGQWAYALGYFPSLRGDQLVAVDLTSPTAPRVRGSQAVRLIAPVVLAISDNLVVIRSESDDGIEIVEVRDGYRFVNAGRKRFPDLPFVAAMALDGRRLYLAGNGDIEIFDLTDREFRQVGGCEDCYRGTASVTQLAVIEDRLLLTGTNLRTVGVGEVLIYDLANLQQPIGSLRLDRPASFNIPTFNIPSKVVAMGSRVYLGEGWPPWELIRCPRHSRANAGLRILDITDPSAPREVSYLSAGDSFVNDVCRP
jgi:hypothetical protein